MSQKVTSMSQGFLNLPRVRAPGSRVVIPKGYYRFIRCDIGLKPMSHTGPVFPFTRAHTTARRNRQLGARAA